MTATTPLASQTESGTATRPGVAVLDMAGTTVDDHGLVYEALRRSVTETGATVSDADLQTLMGTEKSYAIGELARRGGVELGEDRVVQQFARFRQLLDQFYREQPPVPLAGVEEALALLRAAGTGVVLTTGFSRDVAGNLIDLLGWSELVDGWVCGDEVRRGRPAPYLIFRAMEIADVGDVAEVLVAGDTAVDVQAAAGAGVGWRVGVLTGSLDEETFLAHGATHVLGGVRDLPELLDLR